MSDAGPGHDAAGEGPCNGGTVSSCRPRILPGPCYEVEVPVSADWEPSPWEPNVVESRISHHRIRNPTIRGQPHIWGMKPKPV